MIIGGAIVVFAIFALFSNEINQIFSQITINIPQESFEEKEEQKIGLVINWEHELAKTFNIEFKEGMTAFDLLKEKTEEIGLTLKFKTYDMGVFIEAIGDKKNGEDGKYWLYYVNGEMPQVASDKQLLRPGDKVEFKFEKSPF
ncbi:MAG: DUF4430 domain-containing protein [Nanoarchaeota archaeon]|nr:DUF4430 domain-containing protein [Nanoarchaeota archaeon]